MGSPVKGSPLEVLASFRRDDETSTQRLERFRRDFAAGRKRRGDWPLWCWLCSEPKTAAIGFDPLIECQKCYEASYEQAGQLERLVRDQADIAGAAE